MAENVTNELLLEHMKAIQSKLSSMDKRLMNVESEVISLKSHMGAFLQSEARQDTTLVTMQQNIERIERRLELND